MWQKSFLSEPNGGQCVEVDLGAAPQDEIAVRDSKQGEESPVLHFTRIEWDVFLVAAKLGQFDIPGGDHVTMLANAIAALTVEQAEQLSEALRARTMGLLVG